MEQRRTRILIVDDEDSIHRALELTLRREPYELLHAYDAAEAWHVLESEAQIAGVICDHNMPGLKGVDLLVCIRERRPELPTVLLSAQASVEIACTAVNEGGVQGLITKPWDPTSLRAKLRDVFLGERDDPTDVAAIERTLMKELAPLRDPETGAWVISSDED